MKKNIIAYLLAFVSVLAINIQLNHFALTFTESFSGNDIVYVFLLFIIAEFFKKTFTIKDKRIIKISILLAVIIGVIEIVGYSLNTYGDLGNIFYSPMIVFKNLIKFVGYSMISYSVFAFLLEKAKNLNINKLKFPINKKIFFIIWAIIFICWLPYFFYYYPGICSFDSIEQLSQALGYIPLNNHHPIIHTFIIYLCTLIGTKIGTITTAVAIYSIFQMLAMSAIFSFLIYYLLKRKVNIFVIILTFLFVMLSKVTALYSFTMWKDILFAGFFLLFVIYLLEVIHINNFLTKKSNIIIFICITFLVMTLRNNGLYVILLSFLLILILLKKHRKIFGIIFIISIFCYGIYKGPVFILLDIKKEASVDALSVPLQQMARLERDKRHELSNKEKAKIDKWFKEKEIGNKYLSRLSDPVKLNFKNDYFNKHKKEFIIDWFSLFVRYPGIFVESFLTNSYGYWYPETNYWAYSTGIHENNFDLSNNFEIKYNRVDERSIPLISMVYSIGFAFILLLFAGALAIYKKQYLNLISFIPVLTLLLTTMASPVYAEYRYIYGMILCVPLLLGMTLRNE